MKLKGKRVLVIGGGRGIGRALSLGIARQGARVAVAARSRDQIEETCRMIQEESPDSAFPVECDVASMQSVREAIERTMAQAGGLDGVVFAAGVYGPIGPIETQSMDEWSRCLDINLVGAARVIHAVVPHFKKRRSGRIVLFSGGGQAAVPHFSAYVASKGGIWRLTETLGAELAPHGICVNAVAPGNVNTKFLDDLLAAGPEKAGAELYEQSLKQKSEGGHSPFKAAALAIYLLSEESDGLYGKTLSALWDEYENFAGLEEMSKSDVFTFKRVITPAGATRWK